MWVAGSQNARDMNAMHWPIRRRLFGGLPGRQACAAGWAVSRPLEGKHSAQASADRREGTMEAREGRDAMAAPCQARRRGPAMPGDAPGCIQTWRINFGAERDVDCRDVPTQHPL